ncbi:type I restriction endonuclease [Hydrotalea sp.]|uniref:type I restriction endonuclease n=1 Tax=Hydrotalea sp. TaxID=2881279 RepID=UPI00258393B0|nr:type I restriction endonuclease [Hydrotalea sp.]
MALLKFYVKALPITTSNSNCFFDKPVSNLNEKDLALYNQNIFSVTRQVHYSTQNENSPDLVVFINGLPIITFELKNELTKQTVKDAIKQYKTTLLKKLKYPTSRLIRQKHSTKTMVYKDGGQEHQLST